MLMKTKQMVQWMLLVVGIGLVIAGGFAIYNELARQVSGSLIGLGAGLVGASIAGLITGNIIAKNPEYAKKVAIEASDERNIHLNTLAKAKVFDYAQFVALPFMLFIILTKTDLIVLFAYQVIYLASWGVYIYQLNKFTKKM